MPAKSIYVKRSDLRFWVQLALLSTRVRRSIPTLVTEALEDLLWKYEHKNIQDNVETYARREVQP